jgi:WD40 repeat protein
MICRVFLLAGILGFFSVSAMQSRAVADKIDPEEISLLRDLPAEMQLEVLHKFDGRSLLRYGQTDKEAYQSIHQEKALWKKVLRYARSRGFYQLDKVIPLPKVIKKEDSNRWMSDIYFSSDSKRILIQTGPVGAMEMDVESGKVSSIEPSNFTQGTEGGLQEREFGVFWERGKGLAVSCRSFQVLSTFSTPFFYGQTAVFSPNLERIAVVDARGLTVYDPETCRDRKNVSHVSFNASIWDVFLPAAAFSPNSTEIAVNSGQGYRMVEIFNVESGSLVRQLHPSAKYGVEAIAYSKNGKYLAAGSNDSKAYVWNAKTGEHLHVLEGHDRAVTAVVFSRHGRRLFTGSRDGSIKIWSTRTGRLLNTLKSNEKVDDHRIQTIAYSPDGKYVVSGGTDNSIRVWTLAPVLVGKKPKLQDSLSITKFDFGW